MTFAIIRHSKRPRIGEAVLAVRFMRKNHATLGKAWVAASGR